ncbi:MAG: tetratricopeptide repeat protein [Vampirovibrionales bacterium]
MNALKLKTLALVALLLLAPLHAFAQTAEEAYEKGKAAYRKGQNFEAIEYFNQSIQLDAQKFESYFDRGCTKWGLGDYAGAIKDYTKTIQLNPKFATAYNNRGFAKAQSGDKVGAFADLEKAKQLYKVQGNSQGYNNALKNKNLASDLFARQGQ